MFNRKSPSRVPLGKKLPASKGAPVLFVAVAVIVGLKFVFFTHAATSLSGLPWLSGITGGTEPSSWATYRGRPVDVLTIWEDNGTWAGTENAWGLSDGQVSGAYQGKFSVSIPMLSNTSDTLAACASGAYDSHFTALGNTLKKYNQADSFIRLGWEGNGDWYAWSGNTNPTGWINCFRREVTALRAVAPNVQIDWNMGKDGRIDAQQLYPGDNYVDVVGVDFYDMWPAYITQADWDADYNRTQPGYGGPRGIGTWLAFAKSHGKKLSFPEWALTNGVYAGGGGTDNPFYIQKMYDFFKTNAADIAYETYFNTGCPNFCLSPPGINPLASAKYASLWKSAIAGTPTPTATPTPTPTPAGKPGDLNGDGKVNVFDLSLLLAKWGTADATADINHSGKVDVFDLSMLLTGWTG